MADDTGQKKSSETILIAVVILLITILVGVMGYFIIMGIRNKTAPPPEEPAAEEVTGQVSDVKKSAGNFSLHVAHSLCEKELKARYPTQLKALRFDERSSRYMEKTRTIKMFYSLDIYKDGKLMKDTWAKCDVNALTRQITDIELETEEAKRVYPFGQIDF